MNAHRIDVLDRADGDHVVLGIANDLEFKLFPAKYGFFDQHFVDRGGLQAARDHRAQLIDVVDKAAARTAHGVGGTQYARIAKALGDLDRFFDGVGNLRTGHLDAERGHGLLEFVTILAALDRIDLNADHLHAVFVENALVRELRAEVERRLPTEVRQQRIGAFFGDDLLKALAVERFDISDIRRVRIGHDGGGIGVDQHDLVAKRAQCFARLGA